MIVTNYAKKYEECNNYGYYKDFFEENYEACEIIKKCESMAREKYSKFREIMNSKNKLEIFEELKEANLVQCLSEDCINEIKRFTELPNDCMHPFKNIVLESYLKNSDIIVPELRFNLYGLLKIKERSKTDLFADTHFFILNGDNGEGAFAHIDLGRLIGVGVDIRESFTYKRFLDAGSSIHEHLEGKYYNSDLMPNRVENDVSRAWFPVSFEYDAVLPRIITHKMIHGDRAIFEEAIVNAIFDKMVRLQIVLYTYVVYLYGNRDVISNNLETFVKLAFLFKLVYNSVNGIDSDDIGDSIKKLMRDFNYCIHNRGAFDSVIMTADLWRNKLIKGYQDLPSFSDNAINEVLEMYQRKRHAIIAINRTNRPIYADKIITGINMISAESVQEDILSEFNLKKAYTAFKNSPARYTSTISMESVSNKSEFMINRSKLLAKLKPSDRETYIDLENDLMKIKSDAMNCRTADGMKVLINKVNAVGKIIAIEMDTDDEFFKEILGLLDAQRVMLTDMMASRSLIKENNGLLYGMVKMDNKIL